MQNDDKGFTLTSKAGHFVFDTCTIMSHAKLVRDTITAGVRGTIPHTPAPTPKLAQRWIRENLPGPVANAHIAFTWVPA